LKRNSTCITAAAGTGFAGIPHLVLHHITSLGYYLSLAGSSSRPLPNIPHCCQGIDLLSIVALAKDYQHGIPPST